MSYTAPTRTAVHADFTDAYTAPTRTAVDHNFLATGPQGRASAASPLGAALVEAEHIIAAKSADTGPLGAALVYANDGNREGRASDDTGPLQAPSVVATHSVGARSSAEGPLGAALVLAAHNVAMASAEGPLGAALVLAAHNVAMASAEGPLGAALVESYVPPAAWSSAEGPLSTNILVYSENVYGQASAPSPLGIAMGRAWHDFSDVVGAEATQFYVVEFELSTGTVAVPVSSWQATLQTDRQSYVQVVVPAVTDYADTLQTAVSEAADMVVYKGAWLPNGDSVLQEMARGPVETVRFDRGPFKYTATVSGYAEAFAAEVDPPDVTDRTMRLVRSVSSGSGGDTRVRCAIDWFLRPGYTAIVEGTAATTFVAGYINYYVNGNDAFMDVGERSA